MNNEVIEIKQCDYRGETYQVKNDGSVFRLPKNEKVRPTDNIWTYGKIDKQHGYLTIAGVPIHRIVATAFIGDPPTREHVVDHIDTNKQNNRPENLRWVTRLENIIMNPITSRRIELVCGSVENFLSDPSKYKNLFNEQSFDWMKTVSAMEAATCLDNLLEWAKSESPTTGESLGEWIFNRRYYATHKKEIQNKNNDSVTIKNIIVENKPSNKSIKPPTHNPFNFPRPEDGDCVEFYKTKQKQLKILASTIINNGKLMLPDLTLHLGCPFQIENAKKIDYEVLSIHFNGKLADPKYALLTCKGEKIALFIKIKTTPESLLTKLQNDGFNVLEIDLSWSKHGITKEEANYIIDSDVTKKHWIHHSLLVETQNKLFEISEPIDTIDSGLSHTYCICPVENNTTELSECYCCKYQYTNYQNGNNLRCFGKSQIETYSDLNKIINHEKSDEKIISITFVDHNGITRTKTFSKTAKLPGKTLFELWKNRTSYPLIVKNLYSNWYVAIYKNPLVSLNEKGYVEGRINSNLSNLQSSQLKEIYNYEYPLWKPIDKNQ